VLLHLEFACYVVIFLVVQLEPFNGIRLTDALTTSLLFVVSWGWLHLRSVQGRQDDFKIPRTRSFTLGFLFFFLHGSEETGSDGHRRTTRFRRPQVGSVGATRPDDSSPRHHDHCYMLWFKVWTRCDEIPNSSLEHRQRSVLHKNDLDPRRQLNETPPLLLALPIPYSRLLSAEKRCKHPIYICTGRVSAYIYIYGQIPQLEVPGNRR
jgi:hypothetical protein